MWGGCRSSPQNLTESAWTVLKAFSYDKNLNLVVRGGGVPERVRARVFVWRVVCGVWRVACSVWHVACPEACELWSPRSSSGVHRLHNDGGALLRRSPHVW